MRPCEMRGREFDNRAFADGRVKAAHCRIAAVRMRDRMGWIIAVLARVGRGSALNRTSQSIRGVVDFKRMFDAIHRDNRRLNAKDEHRRHTNHGDPATQSIGGQSFQAVSLSDDSLVRQACLVQRAPAS